MSDSERDNATGTGIGATATTGATIQFVTSQANVKRPPNAFMSFSSHLTTLEKTNHPGIKINMRLFSKYVGDAWHALSTEEQSFWYKKQEIDRAEHAAKYPEYEFHPKAKAGAKDVKKGSKPTRKRAKKGWAAGKSFTTMELSHLDTTPIQGSADADNNAIGMTPQAAETIIIFSPSMGSEDGVFPVHALPNTLGGRNVDVYGNGEGQD